jgi:hypothetical protein
LGKGSVSARKPCFIALPRDLALPSAVFGPVDLLAFRRLIRARLAGVSDMEESPIGNGS